MNLESHAVCGHPLLKNEYYGKKKEEARQDKLASENEALRQKANRLENEISMLFQEREYYKKKKMMDEEEYRQRDMQNIRRMQYMTTAIGW